MLQVLNFNTGRPIQVECEPYLVFSNPGGLDINLVKLLGVSVKESDSPIGFFGTGLKYAMATALRLGGSMTIITDGERYEVRGRKVTLRDKDFTQVMLNDEPLGFTTELGKQWEPWMVVRELYSNALDEYGQTMLATEPLSDERGAGNTIITLHGEPFVEVWKDRDQYFLTDDEKSCHETPFADAHESQVNSRSVFYRGIKIHDAEQPTLYRYNLKDSILLTEDRTLRYPFQMREALEKAIISSTDADFIAKSLTTGEQHLEGRLRFEDSYSHLNPSEEFLTVCGKLNARKPRNVNAAALSWYRKRTQSKQPLCPVSLSPVQQKQLEKAAAFIKSLGFADSLDDYPVQVVGWLGEGIYGQALGDQIYLTKQAFDTGTKKLASILLEEFVHCHYKLYDETRAMQSWLFERIITMGEEFIAGEPL
jgi:hypothetical protein